MGDFDDFDDDFELSIKLAPADWRKWFFIKEPNIREAIILALGLDPDDENISKCNKSDFDNWARCVRWKYFAYGSKEIDKHFKILADIASREFVSPETDYYGDDFYYGDKVNIHVFAEWAIPILEKMGLALPPEFPIEQMKTVNENVTNSPKERNSMLAVIYGMAISKYGYKPEAARNAATGENAGSISADLQQLALTCSGETIGKYLKEAHLICGKDAPKS